MGRSRGVSGGGGGGGVGPISKRHGVPFVNEDVRGAAITIDILLQRARVLVRRTFPSTKKPEHLYETAGCLDRDQMTYL